jgi:maltose/moltooligosaccharide transporter
VTVEPSGSAPEVEVGTVDAPTETGPFPLAWSLKYGTGNIGAGMTFGFTNNLLPLYLAGYGLPNAAIGLLAQDRPPTAGVLQIIVGALSDRTRSRLGRRRPYLLVGVPISAVAIALLALHPPVWVALALLLVMTSALAVAYGPYLAMLPDLVPSQFRGRVGGIQASGNMLGQLGLLALAFLLWETQEALVFGLVAGGLVVAFAVTFFGIREGPVPDEPPPAVRFRPGAYVRGLLAEREVAKYLLATFFFWLGNGGVVPFLTRFGVNELGTDERTAFALVMVPLLATILFAAPAGWLGDRFGKKRILTVGLIGMGASVMLGSQVQSVPQAVVLLVVVGAANALAFVMLFPLLADLMPEDRSGEFSGLGSGVWELAQPLGAFLGGLSADMTGSLRTTLFVAALVIFLAAALLAPVRVARAPRSQPPAGGTSG